MHSLIFYLYLCLAADPRVPVLSQVWKDFPYTLPRTGSEMNFGCIAVTFYSPSTEKLTELHKFYTNYRAV